MTFGRAEGGAGAKKKRGAGASHSLAVLGRRAIAELGSINCYF